MKTNKAFKIRIYPTSEQEVLINKTLGSCRFIYNQMLNERIEVYAKLKDDRKTLFEYKYKTEAQYKNEFEFLKEVDSRALVQSNNNLRSAYQNFFNSRSGRRKGGKIGFPKFKSKKQYIQNYRTDNTNNTIRVDFDSSRVRMPKLGWVKFNDKRNEIDGKIKNATLSKTRAGKYFISLLLETEIEVKPIELNSGMKVVGLDMSLDKFFVDDQGSSPAYERIFRNNESKIRRANKNLSRKKDGSKNKEKARLKLAKIHEVITNKRKDFTHKLSTSLITKNDMIVVENLSLKSMSQGLKLGKSVFDLGYGEFLRQLKYKALWNNKLVVEADKFFASSKTCSKCGKKHSGLKLKDRTFECPYCDFIINRDQNAGLNLKHYGLDLLGLNLIPRPSGESKPVEKNPLHPSHTNVSLQDTSVKQEKLVIV